LIPIFPFGRSTLDRSCPWIRRLARTGSKAAFHLEETCAIFWTCGRLAIMHSRRLIDMKVGCTYILHKNHIEVMEVIDKTEDILTIKSSGIIIQHPVHKNEWLYDITLIETELDRLIHDIHD
jgi:hypothetical protein